MLCRTGNKQVLVRAGYSEEATWREALGRREPLLVFSIESGPLDAPTVLPGGSYTATKFGSFPLTIFRG